MKPKTTRKFFVEHNKCDGWLRPRLEFDTRAKAERWFRGWRMGYMHIKGRVVEEIVKIHEV